MSSGVCRSKWSVATQTYTPPDVRVAKIAAEQHGQVSTRQLNACGLDSGAIALRVRAGRLHRVHRGVYAVGHAGLTLRGRFMAAVLACGDCAALSHLSAAAHFGVVRWEDRLLKVTVTHGGGRSIEGVRVHRSRSLERRDVVRHDGIPVTSPARMLLDLAADVSDRALRRVARQAQAERLVSVGQLREIATRCNGHRGCATLLAVVADGPAPTRSPLEDVLLDLLDAAGIPRPEVNAPLRLDEITIIPDYLWRDRHLAIEADSRRWHDHSLTRDHDAAKQAILEAHGYRVLRITSQQAVRQPEQTLARIRAALATR
jgi:hypothetical protein